MSDFNLFTRISSLPEEMKKEVSDFVEFLSQKSKSKSTKKIKQRKFGYAKGFFKIMPGFDDPLEDFKEYM